MERKWISVSDRLPKPEGHEMYLVVVRHKDPMKTGRFIEMVEYEARFEEPEYWKFNLMGEEEIAYVTHWMPLPELPEV